MAEATEPEALIAQLREQLAAKEEELQQSQAHFDEFTASSQELEEELEAELRRHEQRSTELEAWKEQHEADAAKLKDDCMHLTATYCPDEPHTSLRIVRTNLARYRDGLGSGGAGGGFARALRLRILSTAPLLPRQIQRSSSCSASGSGLSSEEPASPRASSAFT